MEEGFREIQEQWEEYLQEDSSSVGNDTSPKFGKGEFEFWKTYHQDLAGAQHLLRSNGFDVEEYTVHAPTENSSLLSDPFQTYTECNSSILGLRYDNPEDVVLELYQRAREEEQPVLGSIPFDEFAPHNGNGSEKIAVEYRIDLETNQPFFSIDTSAMTVEYEETKDYLLDVGMTLREAGYAVQLPPKAEITEEQEPPIYGIEVPGQQIGGAYHPTAADD